MAQTNLTPSFPLDVLTTLVRRIGRKPELGTCDYCGPESSWGACDGFVCNAPATVHDLETDCEFCAEHFAVMSKAVSRG